MKIDLSNKTAIVTGSTAGIGFAIAKGLAEAGAVVVLNGRSEAAVDDAVTRLVETVPGTVVRGHAADVGTAAGCSALVAAEPSVDILVRRSGKPRRVCCLTASFSHDRRRAAGRWRRD